MGNARRYGPMSQSAALARYASKEQQTILTGKNAVVTKRGKMLW
jgi:hypothetical protein